MKDLWVALVPSHSQVWPTSLRDWLICEYSAIKYHLASRGKILTPLGERGKSWDTPLFWSYHSAPGSQPPQCYPNTHPGKKWVSKKEQEQQTRVHTQTPSSTVSCCQHFSCNSLLIPATTRKRTPDQRKMKDEKRTDAYYRFLLTSVYVLYASGIKFHMMQ